MPVHTKRSGKKYQVVDDKGKIYGSHDSKDKANKQTQAVNINMGHVKGLKPRKKKA